MMKLKQARYPYLSTRFRVRKARLLKKSDYEKMIKMDIHTMIKFLEDKGYAFEEIKEENPFEIVEKSMNLNLERELKNILKIAQGNAKKLFELYLLRYDLENVKNLLRCKSCKIFKEDVFIFGGKLSKNDIIKLKDANAEEILQTLRFLSDKEVKRLVRLFEENKIAEVENYLDKKYYKLVAIAAKNLRKEGEILKKFMKLRLDILNLRILFRAKKSGLSKEEMLKMFVTPGNISRKELEELSNLEIEEIRSRIERKFEMLKGIDVKDIGKFDAKLEVYQLKMVEKLMRAHPLSIAPLIGYVIMKEVETRNIKLIARAKYYGLSEDEVRKNLVVIG